VPRSQVLRFGLGCSHRIAAKALGYRGRLDDKKKRRHLVLRWYSIRPPHTSKDESRIVLATFRVRVMLWLFYVRCMFVFITAAQNDS